MACVANVPPLHIPCHIKKISPKKKIIFQRIFSTFSFLIYKWHLVLNIICFTSASLTNLLVRLGGHRLGACAGQPSPESRTLKTGTRSSLGKPTLSHLVLFYLFPV